MLAKAWHYMGQARIKIVIDRDCQEYLEQTYVYGVFLVDNMESLESKK